KSFQNLLDLCDIIGLQFGSGIDGGETSADDDSGQFNLDIGQRVLPVSALALQSHQKIGRHANASGQVVFHLDYGRAARARSNGYVIEPEAPCIFDRNRAAKSDAVQEPELLAPHQDQVINIEKILVPSHGDAVLGDAAESQGGAFG